MNIITCMFEEFLEILGYTSKKKANQEAKLRAKKAYNLAYKVGYSAGYQDALNNIPPKFNSENPTRIKRPELLLLFIKADRGMSIIETIQRNKNISGFSADKLVSDVFRLWVGTEQQFNSIGLNSLFNCDSEWSEVGKEYDSVIIKLKYPMNAPVISKDSDSFSISELIRDIISLSTPCESISNRIPFSKIEKFPLIEL